MKKSLVLILIMLFAVPFLTACEDSQTKNWQAVNNEVGAFLTDGNYSSFVNNSHTYSATIDNAKNNNSNNFSALVMYEDIASSTLFVANNYYGVFAISPLKNNNSANSVCKNVINKLNAVKIEYENFITEKQIFIENIERVGTSNSNVISQNYLQIFKKTFGKFVVKLSDFNNAFTNAYSTLYGGVNAIISTAEEVKRASVQVYSELLSAYIDYSLIEYNYLYTTISANYYNAFYNLKTKILFSTAISDNTSYSTWLADYNLLKNELEMFKISLNSVNLMADNTNPDEKTQIYLTKIENFVKTNARTFINKTIDLLY